MMNDIVIVGAGRSGSSMIAGCIISTKQYNTYGKMHPPDKFNERGYFESNEINKINDDILYSCKELKTTRGIRQGWLSVLSEKIIPKTYGPINSKILNASKNKPFIFKDPRASYVLNCWLPFLQNPKIICVFRHPGEFLSSIIYLCQNAEYLKKIIVDKEFFENVWVSMNQYILTNYKHLNPLFINYNQVLYSNGLDKISEFIETKVNKDFPSKGLRNARRGLETKESTLVLYDQLCCLANCPEELK